MKIIHEEKPMKFFYELASGSVFIHDDVVYMKMDEISGGDEVTGEYFSFNAVFLGDGEPVRFNDSDKVRVCADTVLMIK